MQKKDQQKKGPGGATFHGTAVLLKSAVHDPAGVLLRGASGSGKSDLAFRLIEAGAELIADDQVALEKRQEKLYAAGIEPIMGMLEVRGLGLLRTPHALQGRLRLVIDLVARDEVPRLPDWEEVEILGVMLARLKLHAFDASADLKIRKAMEIVHKPEMIVK